MYLFTLAAERVLFWASYSLVGGWIGGRKKKPPDRPSVPQPSGQVVSRNIINTIFHIFQQNTPICIFMMDNTLDHIKDYVGVPP